MRGRIFILMVAIVVLFVLSTPCMATVPPQNTPEIQSFTTTTEINAVGIVTETNTLEWRMSSELLDTNLNPAKNEPNPDPDGNWVFTGTDESNMGPGDFRERTPADNLPMYWSFPYWPEYPLFADVPIYTNEPPLNDWGEVQMAITYSENTNAVNGVVTYNKGSTIHTGTQTLDNFNVKNDKIVTFKGLDTGRMTSEENILLDNVGTSTSIRDSETGAILPSTICPYAPNAIGNCAPSFCNIALTGSKVDVSVASLATDAKIRSVGSSASGDDEFWPPLPVVDGPPVELDYSINLVGVGTGNNAEGSAMGYFKAHKAEGGRECPSGFAGAAQEITYNEVSSASGSISRFQKIMNYQSGYSHTGCATCG
jgi:hypothetical protein